jgi:hypothetical protein
MTIKNMEDTTYVVRKTFELSLNMETKDLPKVETKVEKEMEAKKRWKQRRATRSATVIERVSSSAISN